MILKYEDNSSKVKKQPAGNVSVTYRSICDSVSIFIMAYNWMQHSLQPIHGEIFALKTDMEKF